MATQPDAFQIRSAVAEDFPTVERLCALRFGKGYLKREEFDRWLAHPELFLVMECEGDFVGYVCFVPETPEEMAAYIRFPVEEVRREAGDRPAIHCRSTALFSAYEHKGLMRALWVRILDTVQKEGYRVAYGPAWKYNGFVPMHRLLTSFGFVPLCEKQGLWYEDESYTCVVCGGRCSCPAVIYQLKI